MTVDGAGEGEVRAWPTDHCSHRRSGTTSCSTQRCAGPGHRRRRPRGAGPTAASDRRARTLVKALYPPLQVSVQGVDERTPTPRADGRRDDLGHARRIRRPALGPAALLIGAPHRSRPRVAYVMTDGGALRPPSHVRGALAPSLAGWSPSGQAWGGDSRPPAHPGCSPPGVCGRTALVTSGRATWHGDAGASRCRAGERARDHRPGGDPSVPCGSPRRPAPPARGSPPLVDLVRRVALGGVTLVAPRGLSSGWACMLTGLAGRGAHTVVWVDTPA